MFSSQPRLIAAGILFALLALAAMIYIQESVVIPKVTQQQVKHLEEFPVLLATSNQKAILTNDLATLTSTLKQVISNAEATGSGLRYVIMQNAEGKVLARMESPRWSGDVSSQLTSVLRGERAPEGNQEEGATSALEELGGVPSAASIPVDQLPPIAANSKRRFRLAGEEIMDIGVPLARGAITFGAVRVGVVYDANEVTAAMRMRTYLVALLLGVLFIGTLFGLSGNIDTKFAANRKEQVARVSAEMEQKINKLESLQEKAEEDTPVAPSDLLSLLDFARNVSAVLEYAQVLEIAIDTCLHTLGVRDASIFLLDAASNELVGKIGHDDRGFVYDEEMGRVRVPLGSGDIGAAAEFGTTTVINEPKPGTAVVAALVSRGRTIGVILVRNKFNGRAFIKKDQTVLRILAGILANAMDNAALFHHLGSRGSGLSMPST